MPSKPIRIDLVVISELDKLRPLSPSSYSDIISNLLRSHRELTKIEQNDMSHIDSKTTPKEPLKSPLKKQSININKNTKIKPLSKNEPKLMLFCFECQEQTPHIKLKTKQILNHPFGVKKMLYKCSICGSRRNV